jgi:myo-inositol-1(or 4)-monophosphatase
MDKKQMNLEGLEELIKSTCFEVGSIISKEAFSIRSLEFKSLDDPVTNLDKEAEKLIIKRISEKYNANFLGEEYGRSSNGSDLTFYIDPIDGTKSFVKGEFNSSVSIAATYKNELVLGAVYDFMRDILYVANDASAYMTRSTWKSQEKLNLPRIENIFSKKSILIECDDKYVPLLKNEGLRTGNGSVALQMAQLASGSIQGLVLTPRDKGGASNICDVAAGYLIMKQSGIIIKDYDLNEFDYKKPSNGLIAGSKELIDVLSK